MNASELAYVLDMTEERIGSVSSLWYLIHHCFLPPQLPQSDDFDCGHEFFLLETITSALKEFTTFCGPTERPDVQRIKELVSSLALLHDGSDFLQAKKLEEGLHKMISQGTWGVLFNDLAHISNPDTVLPVYIRAQNAGLLIIKTNHDVVLQAFELSPTNQSSMSTKGRLQRSFPSCAVAVGHEDFLADGFIATLSSMLAKLSNEAGPGMQPTVRKARQNHQEDRDTCSPALVTEYLISFLRAVGRDAEVSVIWKNTREEVLWLDCLRPWHRSPMWLLFRVCLQLVLSGEARPDQPSQQTHKRFIVFLLAHILHLSLQVTLPSDIIYAMTAKIVRRLLKLQVSLSDHWASRIKTILMNAHSLLDRSWQRIIGQTVDFDFSNVKSLQLESDTHHVLPELDSFIFSIARRPIATKSVTFVPKTPSLTTTPDELPTISGSISKDYQVWELAAFEKWVELDLQTWLVRSLEKSTTCDRLRRNIRSYHAQAAPLYAKNPETYSQMILTIMDLWIACDKSACSVHNLLSNYDPEIPQNLFQSLILPFRNQMQRISNIEEYLSMRRQRVKYTGSHILHTFGNKNDFAMKYFEQSSEHQVLYSDILSAASRQRADKVRELSSKQQKYRDLLREYNAIEECDRRDVLVDRFNQIYESHHSGDCRKCAYKHQANSITITVHEWPLSDDPTVAKSTVFELRVPAAFASWRDSTIFLLQEVLGTQCSTSSPPQAKNYLHRYGGLSSYVKNPNQGAPRLVLLSEVKPHLNTHRSKKHIANMEEEDVCVKNALKLRYFDDELAAFTGRHEDTDLLSKHCTYALSSRRTSMQKFLDRPPHMPSGMPPNTVMADQHNCPLEVPLDEFRVFCSLPLGFRIQWMNILRQLTSPWVDFTNPDTILLIFQTVFQAGPSDGSNIERVGHAILRDEEFASTLFHQLESALSKVSENWDAAQALSCFTSLAARILSINPSARISTDCLSFLKRAREITFDWTHVLIEVAHSATNEGQRLEALSKAVEVALMCASTFDIEPHMLKDVLASPCEASLLIRCSALVQEHLRSVMSKQDQIHQVMLERWKRLMFRALSPLVQEILEMHNPCLDMAVQKTWSAYKPSSAWQNVSGLDGYWITTTSGRDDKLMTVHFNLLTAELLVDGLPLSRLPREYEEHSVYQTLFGRSTIAVMPARLPGMAFSAKKPYADHTIYFGIERSADYLPTSGVDLLIQTSRRNHNHHLIPGRLFRGRIPNAFIDNFIHWYNHADETVELRPLSDPWPSSTSGWRFQRIHSFWILGRGETSLLSLRSESYEVLSKYFCGLEEKSRLHITLHATKTSRRVEIELPRSKLGFFFQPGSSIIESQQFRDMHVDPTQCIGTLVGLESKLVLKSNDKTTERLILVPEGYVAYRKTAGHLSVTIDKAKIDRVHAYRIDALLGRLSDDGSLQSKLFLAYLHALTSHCLPDPLILRTGTEQALQVLESAAVRSFANLSKENLATLELLGNLTPGRRYYPHDKQIMQSVGWNSQLSFMSQHGKYHTLVDEIFKQAKEMDFLYPTTSLKIPSLKHVDRDLLERDLARSSVFQIEEYEAGASNLEYDSQYISRDCGQNSGRANSTLTAANAILRQRPTLFTQVDANFADTLFNLLRTVGDILGLNQKRAVEIPPRFDVFWLGDLADTAGYLWCQLHQYFLQTPGQNNKFHISSWLAAIAFANPDRMQVVQVLAAMCSTLKVSRIIVPSLCSYRLNVGTEPNKSELADLVRNERKPFRSSPEAHGDAPQASRHMKFQNKQNQAISDFVTDLMSQWPCEEPRVPQAAGLGSYIKITQAYAKVKPKFETWHRNRCFKEYLGSIAVVLHGLEVHPISFVRYHLRTPAYTKLPVKSYIGIHEIFGGDAPIVSSNAPARLDLLATEDLEEASDCSRLSYLLSQIEARDDSRYARRYAEDLRESLSSLRSSTNKMSLSPSRENIPKILGSHLAEWDRHVRELFSAICRATQGHTHTGHYLAFATCHAPRLSPVFILQQLRKSQWKLMSDPWKACVIRYCVALTELQRAYRLCKHVNDEAALISELLNIGHANWNPKEFPESLLFEVENAIMIRAGQEEIARHMRMPPSSSNAVMQLNMGEGKSTVIVPVVAAALADGTRLVRVIVAKPQAKQMSQILVSKLAGMLNRRVYYLPFSRSVKLNRDTAQTIERICRECMNTGGVLMVQPEHILSLKLMSLDQLIRDDQLVGNSLLKLQTLFEESSRDIIDESDENFGVKFELIYTMGQQRPIEYAPERWIVIQELLKLFVRAAAELKRMLPDSIEFEEHRAGAFPRVRILHPDAINKLAELVAVEACCTTFPGCPIAWQPQNIKNAIFVYITKPNLSRDEIVAVEHCRSFWTSSTKSPLLLLRGLLAGGVLAFVFGMKRWRVNYGPHPARQPPTRLAVPYRAKDNPTQRSEFSHPDVSIVLALLIYYYGGLEDEDLFTSFDSLLKSDQGQAEYDEWLKYAPNLPASFRQLIGVNVKDRLQCLQKVFPHLRYSKGAIDYFLSHVVFPKEMKEFPYKISVSGWDLGQVKKHPTTGFSGTNDSRYVLPLNVSHLDLAAQKHTNALVLEYLLRNENSVILLPQKKFAAMTESEVILETINTLDPPPQVVLDVGAQILDSSNHQFAETWLRSKSDHEAVRAVIFFDDNDELSVLDRDNGVELLQTSPFSKQTGVCLVFLDEAHTRGTDLKLPTHYRAAVTLGANLTKDKLIQGMQIRPFRETQLTLV